MGSGISSLPAFISKTEFYKIVNGNRAYDTLFDQYAVDGVISRESLIEMSEIKDCYLSYHIDDVDLAKTIHSNYTNQGLRVGFITDANFSTSTVPITCQSIDNSITVVMLFTENYKQSLNVAPLENQVCTDFLYTNRTKHKCHKVILTSDLKTFGDNLNQQTTAFIKSIENVLLLNDKGIQLSYDYVKSVCRLNLTRPIKLNVIGDTSLISKDEAQLYIWMSRCSSIDEYCRIIYCSSIIQKGVFNIHQLAKDADELGVAVQDIGVGYVHSRDFTKYDTLEQVTFAIKKTLEGSKNSNVCCSVLQCIERYIECKTIESNSNDDLQQQLQHQQYRAKQLYDIGFITVLVKIYHDYFEDINVLTHACRVMTLIIANSNDSLLGFGESQICFILVRSMSKYITDANFISESCFAMAALSGNSSNRNKIGIASGCEVVCKIIQYHMNDKRIIEGVTYAIEKLQIGVYENTTKLGLSGANLLIIQALKTHIENPNIVLKIFRAFLCLSVDTENRNILGKNGCPIFIEAMNRHISNLNIIVTGCQFVVALVISIAFNREQLTKSGIDNTIKSILTQYFRELNRVPEDLLKSVSMAIYSLVNGSPQNKTKFASCKEILNETLTNDINNLTKDTIAKVKEAITLIT